MAEQSERIILEAGVRAVHGKGSVHSIRRQGFVPGVVYGEGKSSIPIQVAQRDLSKALHTKAGENVLIALRLKGGEAKKTGENLVLIKELQHHPVSHQIIHVDFHHVLLTKRIKVAVPLAFKGDAVGVKAGGGILEHLRWEVEVECLPTQIPSEIAVDVSNLDVGATLTAKAISLPAGIRLLTDPELPIVTCQIPKEEVLAPAVEEAQPEAAEPEVIKQKKPEEAGAQETEGKEKKEPAAKEKEKAKG